jgi:selenide,water dikinase
VKRDKCSEGTIEEFTASMAALNRKAAEVMLDVGVSTATDITGFGLIGHLQEVLSASRCDAQLSADRVPFFDAARELAEQGVVPGGTWENLRSFDPLVRWSPAVPDYVKLLMNDAQTSGGLLIFVPSDKREKLIKALREANVLAAHIGAVVGRGAGKDILIEVDI